MTDMHVNVAATMHKTPLYVYVSGPYTLGGQGENVRRAVLVADAIRNLGHCFPFVPHLFHHWDMISPRSYTDWLQLCIAYLRKCDVFVRLPGVSQGSDAEEAVAQEMHIPIYHDYQKFLDEHG